MSVLLKSYVDASGELVFFVENGDNDTLATSDSTLTRVQGGDITVSDDLSTIEGNPLTDGLQAQITANSGNITTLQNDVAQEIIDRTAADIALQAQITSNDGDIATLGTGVSDNENDIIALQSGQTLQDDLISTNSADIAQEVTDRQAADTALQGQITTNSGDITVLQTDLAAEVANRIAGDSSLLGQIQSNDTDISALQGDISSLEAQDIAFNAQQTAQDGLIAVNTAKVSFPEAPNDGQQYARQSEGWTVVAGGGGGITPPPSTDNAIVRFDGAAGQVQDSNVFIDDLGRVGIGRNNPEREFHIDDGNFRIDRTGNSTSLWFVRKEVGGAILKSFRIDNDAFGSNDGQFTISDVGTAVSGSATPRFRIENDGNIDVFLNRIQNVGLPTEVDDAVPLRLIDTVKVRSTATGNLNTGVATFNNFTTTDELGSTFGQFTFATNGITPNFTGAVRIDFNIELNSFSPRPVVGFRWSHNGNVGPWCRHTYIRDTSGHTESSGNFSTVIPVVAGQPIQIQHDNFAAGGTVNSPANGAEFIIQRIR